MKMLVKAAALLSLAPSTGFAHKQNSETEVRPTANTPPPFRQLGYYIGTWEGHGETKGGPFGKAGKLSSKQTCKWFAGGHQVICRGEEMGPTGQRQFLNILAYDESNHGYTEYSVSSRGESEYDTGGSLVSGKLTFVVEQDAGGKPAKFQVSETHVSPTLYTYKAQVSVAGGSWTELGEGKIRKVRGSSR
jgi:hypothetical protein